MLYLNLQAHFYLGRSNVFPTLISVSSRFLHTSFLSAVVMSDFFIRTRYLLKKSGYVHLEERHTTHVGISSVNCDFTSRRVG